MDRHGADDAAFGASLGIIDPAVASVVAARVRTKLAIRPIEATCIDFEDGYGPRADEEEDRDATRVGTELAGVDAADVQVGIRIKALQPATFARAVRTLDRFVTAHARANRGVLRAGFTVTLPKVEGPEEVAALVDLLEALEHGLGLTAPISGFPRRNSAWTIRTATSHGCCSS